VGGARKKGHHFAHQIAIVERGGRVNCLVWGMSHTDKDNGGSLMTIAFWIFCVSAFAVLLAFSLAMRRKGQISTRAAASYVKHGALVVDVRSPREYNAGHLSQAFNFPLDELEGSVAQRVKDKSRVILVHCRTGLRSKKAKERLARIGYTNVFVLGSYARALKIVTGRAL
jgi:rhodanese-related sulfurtransferase